MFSLGTTLFDWKPFSLLLAQAYFDALGDPCDHPLFADSEDLVDNPMVDAFRVLREEDKVHIYHVTTFTASTISVAFAFITGAPSEYLPPSTRFALKTKPKHIMTHMLILPPPEPL